MVEFAEWRTAGSEDPGSNLLITFDSNFFNRNHICLTSGQRWWRPILVTVKRVQKSIIRWILQLGRWSATTVQKTTLKLKLKSVLNDERELRKWRMGNPTKDVYNKSLLRIYMWQSNKSHIGIHFRRTKWTCDNLLLHVYTMHVHETIHVSYPTSMY